MIAATFIAFINTLCSADKSGPIAIAAAFAKCPHSGTKETTFFNKASCAGNESNICMDKLTARSESLANRLPHTSATCANARIANACVDLCVGSILSEILDSASMSLRSVVSPMVIAPMCSMDFARDKHSMAMFQVRLL